MLQMCKTCCSKGHHMDVCPQPDARVCHICGTRDPTDGHVCVPKSASSGGEHITGYHHSTQRLKQPRATATKPKRAPNAEREGLRWFSSEEKESELRYGRKPWSTNQRSTQHAMRETQQAPPPSLHLHANQDRGQGCGNEQQTSRGGKQRNHRLLVEAALDLWGSSNSRELHLPLCR
ncbi:hypothetical protein HPB51_005408 [Rhipicephalus microplus]|uniref:Uncharacterized protein n=1 Tax=Rhipicephalus microplus TaxID=6941 RepID=A0A9J6DZQ9_RHIMP|nr:hypothetical protein HPB51_005408 [Rhipicephalus microplus]